MCIICVSPTGVRQPSINTIRTMFMRNPHGAGYMYARDGKVHIRKGFMNIGEFLRAIKYERFTEADPVVYHFRISTQAGVGPAMTHPFPLSNHPEHMKALAVNCPCGIAHNGVIKLTSDPTNTEFSDTATFILEYLSDIIHSRTELKNPTVHKLIYQLAQSKFAMMDGSGYIATIGPFIDRNGLLFSNHSFEMPRCAV